ncbi:hypothetical protein [Accumulibacter sp.]|uniref:hypothetical protein n=1 Tax=Accumulibacter sp. TaxID=2053492 RepID=UPI002582DCA8|nr:hypothetical protein [Accumulibacter sp.]
MNTADQTAIEIARDKADYTAAADSLTDSIKRRLQTGEIIGALDFPECDRPLFWSAIARIRDDLPCVRPTWRTIAERHVDGVRVRQQLFRLCSRQKGFVDPMLAGLIGGPL